MKKLYFEIEYDDSQGEPEPTRYDVMRGLSRSHLMSVVRVDVYDHRIKLDGTFRCPECKFMETHHVDCSRK